MKIKFTEVSKSIKNIWVSLDGGKTWPVHIVVTPAIRYNLLNNGYEIPLKKSKSTILLKTDNGQARQIFTQTKK